MPLPGGRDRPVPPPTIPLRPHDLTLGAVLPRVSPLCLLVLPHLPPRTKIGPVKNNEVGTSTDRPSDLPRALSPLLLFSSVSLSSP